MSYFESHRRLRAQSQTQKPNAILGQARKVAKGTSRRGLRDITNNRKGSADPSEKVVKKPTQYRATSKPLGSQRLRSCKPGGAVPVVASKPEAERRMLLAGGVRPRRTAKPGFVNVFSKSSTTVPAPETLPSLSSRLARKHIMAPRQPVMSSPSIADMDLDSSQDQKALEEDELFEMELDEPGAPVTQSLTALGGKFDVDSADLSDELAAAEYVDDIMQHLRQAEIVHQADEDYMINQNAITPKMREILISWLVEVHAKFKLRLESLYLAVNILDRFLSKVTIRRSKLQLMGCSALLLGCKYEEIFAPEINDFVYICDRAYSREEIMRCECHMLNTLKFNLSVPYSFRFAERLMKVASADEMTCLLAAYITELSLQKYEMLRYTPSMIGAAASFLALSLRAGGTLTWTPQLAAHANYTQAELMPCAKDLYAIFCVKDPKNKAVRVKYSSSRRQRVALGPFPTLDLGAQSH